MKMNDIVYAVDGEFAFTEKEYLDMIYREIQAWWENATEDERDDYNGNFAEFLSREKDNWLNEDTDFTYYECWLEAHEEH